MTEIKKLQEEIKENKDKIKDLQGEIDSLESRKDDMKNKLNNTDDYQEKGSLQQGIKFIDDDIEPLKTKQKKIRKKNQELNRSIKDKKARVHKIKTRILDEKERGIRQAKTHKRKIEQEYKNKSKSAKEQVKNAKRGYNNFIKEIINLAGKQELPEEHDLKE